VEIAPQHPKGERIRAGEEVVEGLFFSWVALQGGDVSPGHLERAAAVEAHLADPAPAFSYQAAVAARCAAHRLPREQFNQFPGRCHRIQDLGQA
jgi:hypothetical protein